MNFTREPIIETVITPREGCVLVVRSSKANGQEDYFVDAIEVVSFGHSFFFRSQERPKSFLVPVSDYEVLELKETRMVLKNVASDRSVKIGGGRDTPPPARPREEPMPQQDAALAESRPAPVQEQRPTGKRDNKRRRGRRGRDRHDPQQQQGQGEQSHAEHRHEGHHEPREESQEPPEEHRATEDRSNGEFNGEPKAPSFISKLFPPPQTLIKDTLSRYKPQEGEAPIVENEPEDDNEE